MYCRKETQAIIIVNINNYRKKLEECAHLSLDFIVEELFLELVQRVVCAVVVQVKRIENVPKICTDLTLKVNKLGIYNP